MREVSPSFPAGTNFLVQQSSKLTRITRMLVTNTERERKKNNGRGEQQQVGKNKNLEVFFEFDHFKFFFFLINVERWNVWATVISEWYFYYYSFVFFFLIFRGIITIFTGFQHCQLHGEGKRKKIQFFLARASISIILFAGWFNQIKILFENDLFDSNAW